MFRLTGLRISIVLPYVLHPEPELAIAANYVWCTV